MNQKQRDALEALLGRPMSPTQVEAIDPLLESRNDVRIAELLGVDRKKIVSTEIGVGTILGTLFPGGGKFLSTLEAFGQNEGDAAQNVRWTMFLIKDGRLNVGLAYTRAAMEDLGQNIPTMAEPLAKLMALAERPDPIHFSMVSDALNKAEERMTL